MEIYGAVACSKRTRHGHGWPFLQPSSRATPCGLSPCVSGSLLASIPSLESRVSDHKRALVHCPFKRTLGPLPHPHCLCLTWTGWIPADFHGQMLCGPSSWIWHSAGEPGVGVRPSLLRGNLCNETSFLVLPLMGGVQLFSHLPASYQSRVASSVSWLPGFCSASSAWGSGWWVCSAVVRSMWSGEEVSSVHLLCVLHLPPHVHFSPHDKWSPVIVNGVAIAYSRNDPFSLWKHNIPLEGWAVILSFLLLDA